MELNEGSLTSLIPLTVHWFGSLPTSNPKRGQALSTGSEIFNLH